VPLLLSPMYELPARVELASPRFLVPALFAVSVTIGLVLARRSWPAALAVWLVYGLTLAPVSGIVHNGPQLVADRYSYLSCLGIALLVGAAVAAAVSTATIGRPVRAGVVLVSFAWLTGLTVLTVQQLPVWADAQAVWRRGLEVDPDCVFCHDQTGALSGNRGDLATAIGHFARVVELRPGDVRYRSNLGLALLKAGRSVEAAAQFERILDREPTDAETRTRFGLALAQQGKLADASREFERASRDDPRSAGALTQLGISLIALGRPAEAIPYLESAARLDPASPIVRDALARARSVSAR